LTLDTRPISLDQPIRPSKHVWRNRQADLLSRFQINYQLKLHRLLHGEIARLYSFKNSARTQADILLWRHPTIIWELGYDDVLPDQIPDIDNRVWAKVSGFALACLSSLNTCQALLKTVHLFFHDPHFDIQGLIKLMNPSTWVAVDQYDLP